MAGSVREIVARAAREEELEYEIEEAFALEPLALDPELVQAVGRAAEREGARSMPIASGAGHDAMVIGRHAPAAMLFVPSQGGISHSPAERTPDEQLELGTRVLTACLRERLRSR